MANMRIQQFDKKWEYRLEEGFDGLSFNDPKIVKLVDETFTRWETEYPHFTLSQIKYKFGTSRVYCDNVPFSETNKLEQEINKLL
jgi:hypothetical protein